MSSDGKFRMHMGCGEPLQCRHWAARPGQELPGGKTHGEGRQRDDARRVLRRPRGKLNT